jgi:biotin synthase
MLMSELLLRKAVSTGELNREGIIELLNTDEPEAMSRLFRSADEVRQAWVGSEIFLRGIIEFSNYCTRSCLYCGLRRENRLLNRYRMNKDDILAAAREIKKHRIPTLVLQSGEDPFFTGPEIAQLVEAVKRDTGMIITLSIGERSFNDYRDFRNAGADRYLLKHETADENLYRYFRPGEHLSERIQCLSWLRELGFEVGTGNMVGLPGQTVETLANDLLLMKSLGADMLGIGPFIAHPDTPLCDAANGDLNMTLKTLAIARLLTRTTNLPATTATEVIDSGGRLKALACGANVVMPNFTPTDCKERYVIYPGKAATASGDITLSELQGSLRIIGRTINFSSGFRVTS